MSERLTETLVRQGQLSPEAAQAALERQVLMGGALDTALLEIGVDQSLVLAAFREAYETPLADLTEIEAPLDQRAIRAIPEQWARRHQLAPLSMDDEGRTLDVLSPAPPDLELLVRLSELLDLRLRPRLALEAQVVHRLSRLYGMRPPDRFLPLVTQRPQIGTGVEPLNFAKATEALRRAEHRDGIARALLGFAMRELAFGALLVVTQDELRGWMGFGPNSQAVPNVEVPISDPSAFRMVIDSQGHYLGPRPDDETQERLSRAFGRQQPRTVVLAPIRLKARTVALLYGENGPDPIPARLAGDLMLLVTHVQKALEQLVLRQKASSLPEAAPTPAGPVSEAAPTPIPAPSDPRAAITPLPDDEASSQVPSAEPVYPVPEPAPDGLPDDDVTEDGEEPLAITAPPMPSTTELPDEPIYPDEGDEDDDWEPVAVSRTNFVQGVELTQPEVVPAPAVTPSRPVVTAPQSSRDVPILQMETDFGDEDEPMAPADGISSDAGWGGVSSSDRLVPVDLAPRTVQRIESADVPIEAPILTRADDPISWADTSSGTDPRGSTEPQAPAPAPAPSDPAPTLETPAATALDGPSAAGEGEIAPTGPRDQTLDGPTGDGLAVPRMPMPEETFDDSEDLSWEPALPPADAPFVEDEAESHTEDMPDQLWEVEGRGLAEKMLSEAAEDDAPSDVQWDVVEPSAWSEPGMAAPEDEPSVSQPVLLTERVERQAPQAEGAPESDGDDESTQDVDALMNELTAETSSADERLFELGPDALPQMIEHFPGPHVVDPFQRRTVPSFEDCGPLLAVFSRFGRDAHPYVARCLESPEPLVRFYATHFYSVTRVPECIPRLIQRLHDEEPRICMVAARTLFGYRDHPDFSFVLDHLHGRLEATSHAARRHAAYLIGLFRDVTAIPKLIDILDRRERSMVDVVLDALAEITKQRFGSNSRKWRTWYQRNKDRSRILWLIDGLSSKDEALRKSAAEELRAVTRKDFGFEHDGPRRRREEARQRWIQWWEREGRSQLEG